MSNYLSLRYHCTVCKLLAWAFSNNDPLYNGPRALFVHWQVSQSICFPLEKNTIRGEEGVQNSV